MLDVFIGTAPSASCFLFASLADENTDGNVSCALQAEFLRDALYRFLPSATLDRVNRVIKRLQAGKFEGTLGRSSSR